MTFPAQIFRIPQKCYHQAQWKTKPQGKTIERREPRQRHNNVRVARWEATTYFDIILDSSWELHIREPWNNSGKNKSRGQIIKPVLNIGLCYGNIRTNVSLYINIFLHAVLLMSMYDSTTWLCEPFLNTSPDVWLDTNLFLSCTGSYFDLRAWFLLWYALSAACLSRS